MLKEIESNADENKLLKALPTDLKKYIEVWEEFYASLLGKLPQAQTPVNPEEVKKKADEL